MIPIFSMRREPDHGIGDLLALTEWVRWAYRHQVSFLQLLPVNALGDGVSPYSAVSSVALEWLYLALDPEWVPGLDEVPAAMPQVGARVDYAQARKYKDEVLRRARVNFLEREEYAGVREECAAWVAAQGSWLAEFASYMVLARAFGSENWWQWPIQDPAWAQDFARRDEDEWNFEVWKQWLLARQWERVREFADGMGVRLMGDMPIGVSMASADVFFQRQNFDLDWSCGSPPEGQFGRDPFSVKWGQNWGLPLLDWGNMERDNFAWWRQRVDGLGRIFHMMRLDHVLGFYRIYAFPWKPWQNQDFLDLGYDQARQFTGGRLPGFFPNSDDTPEGRRNNLTGGDYRLRRILSGRRDIEFIAEDLGATPDYVRPSLRQLGIPGIIVPQWTTDLHDDPVPGVRYHPASFATYATHDHPPLMASWADFREMANARPNRLLQVAIEGSKRMVRIFCEFANLPLPLVPELIPEWDSRVKDALFRALFASNSRYAALMFTDLFDIPENINIPGVIDDRNWKLRMPFTASDAPSAASRWLMNMIITSGRSSCTQLVRA